MTVPEKSWRRQPYWRMQYSADRRKHHHRCRHCNRIVKDGEEVFMARLANGKTKDLHVLNCADELAIHDVTELQLLECHGVQYLAKIGIPGAQEWLDRSPLTQTRPSVA